MKCLICNSQLKYYFSKSYQNTIYAEMTKDIEPIEYEKCEKCGFTISNTHAKMNQKNWEKLNYDLHHYHENNKTGVNQPPYLEQSMMINVLLKNQILEDDMLDYAGGYGTLSKSLKKYFDISLPVYDPYVQSDDFKDWGFGNPTIDNQFRNAKVGKIKIGKFAIIGANTTILPDVNVGECVAVAANSLITKDLEPWGIYVGNKKVGMRNKEEVLKNHEEFLATPENERVGSLFK